MNSTKFFIEKIVLGTLVFVISAHWGYGQNKIKKQNIERDNFNPGANVQLIIHEKVILDDGLSLTLNYFIKKIPTQGEATKISVHVTLTKDTASKQVTFCAYGLEDNPPLDDEMSENDRRDIVRWKEYKLQLRNIVYNKSVELKIFKKK
jgi:hypothetical protein